MRKEERSRSGRNPAIPSKQRHSHLQPAHSVRVLRRNAAALAVAACFSAAVVNPLQANPTNPTVVNGAAKFTTTGNLLSITNTPSAIINWGSFSIGASEITRFVQQSASSAVLNRVVGQTPSSLLGALQSNGRVFLINANGIVFGAGSQINVGGLVASTLNLSNEDFLAGRLRFTEGSLANTVANTGNSLTNSGSITTSRGGNVYLIGSAVTNHGIITSPKGEVILAAGNSIELVNPGTPDLRVAIVAPDNKALNLGQIAADSGRIGIYAGLINHGGAINANSVVVGETGQIMLKASKNTTLVAGSTTTANAPSGGKIEIQSGDTTLVSGNVQAHGVTGTGGDIKVLGNLVGLTGNATLNASGNSGGGSVLVGGDFQGKNANVQNAFRTFVGADASISADAVSTGNGGKVVVWGDDVTRYYGNISARGGAQSGNGGSVEVSGKRYLDYAGHSNTSAPFGTTGTLLLDPADLTINDGTAEIFNGGSFTGGTFTGATGTANIIWDTIATELVNNTVILTTSGTGGNGDITVTSASGDLSATTVTNGLKFLAHRNIAVNAGAVINTGSAGALQMIAGWDGGSTTTPVVTAGTGNISISANVSNTAGNVTLTAGNGISINSAKISVGGASKTLSLDAGSGGITVVNSTLQATGTANSSATVNLKAGGLIELNTASSISASSAAVTGGAGGSATVDIQSTGGAINLKAGSVISTTGAKTDAGTGGAASTLLQATNGAITILGSTVSATGGGSKSPGAIGGAATTTLTASGAGLSIVDNGTTGSTISATGGANNDTLGGGAGGAATIVLTATQGTYSSDALSIVTATGGTSLAGNGTPSVTLKATLSDVTIRGAIKGTVGQGVMAVTAGNDIVLTTTGSIVADTGARPTVDLTASNNVQLNGSVTSTGSANGTAVTITATNGAMTNSGGGASGVITVQGNINSAVVLSAKSGIGTTGNPIRYTYAGAGPAGTATVTATNGTASGNIVLSQTTRDLVTSNLTLTNNFVGGGIDIKSEVGSITVPGSTVFKNDNGAMTLRAATNITLGTGTTAGSVTAGTAANAGDILLIADTMGLNGVVNTKAGAGTVTLQTATANRSIDLGGVDVAGAGGALGIDTAEFSKLTAASVVIGNAATPGNPIVNAAPVTVPKPLTIHAGANPITLSTQTTNDFTGAVSLNNSGTNDVAIRDINGLTLAVTSVGRILDVTAGAPGITLTGNVTSAGAQTFIGGTTLAASVTLNADAANAISLGAVTGAGFNLTTTGLTTIASTVSDLGALQANQTLSTTGAIGATSVAVTGATTLGGNVTTSGAQSYTGALTLNATPITLTGTTPTFNGGTVGAGKDLTLSFSGTTTIDGAKFTGINALTSNNGGTTNLTGAITTAGAQTYTDAVTLTGATTLNAGAANGVSLGAVTGAGFNLTTTGLTTIASTVSDLGALIANQTLTTSGALGATSVAVAGAATLGGNVTTTGAQSYTGAVNLSAPVIMASSANGQIQFVSTVDGAQALTVNTGGVTRFDAPVGSTSALTTLTTDAPGTTIINSSIGTTGAINLNDAVSGNNLTLNAGASPITLANPANDFAGTLTLIGSNAIVQDASALTVVLNTTGSNNLTAVGVIAASGTFSNLTASATGAGSGIAAVSTAPTFTVTGATTNNGPVTLGNTAGNLLLNGTTASGTGDLRTSASGTQTLAGGTVTAGSYTLGGGGLALAGGTLNVTNVLTVSSGATLSGGAGTLNAGTVIISNGGVLTPGGGTVTIGTTNIQAGGTLNGVGTVAGNVITDGIVSPGNSPGILTIAGNFVQGSAGLLNIELGGLTPGTGFDQLVVTGNASLNGTLGLLQVPLSGFVPAPGSSYRFLSVGGSSSGTFSSILIPAAFAGMAVSYQSQFTEALVPVPISNAPQSNNLIAASQPIVIYEERATFTEEERKDIFEQLCK